MCARLLIDRRTVHIIDGFPIETCVTTHVSRSTCFKGEAQFGYCAAEKKHFYGFQGHLLVDNRGIPVRLQLTPANVDERDAAYELLEGISGVLIGVIYDRRSSRTVKIKALNW